MTMWQAMRKAYTVMCEEQFQMLMDGQEGTERWKDLCEAIEAIGNELGIISEEE